jgi:thiol-disulfide isomerase/thioredoxin
VSLARGKRPDCHCFGQIKSAPVGWNTIARNGVLAAMAGFVIMQGQSSALDSVTWIWPVLLVVLFLVAAAAFAMTVLLLRQNGRLALRIEALEEKLGIATAPEPGLPVDTPAPRFSSDSPGDAPVLLFFTNAGCSACEAMLPEVERWQRDHHDRLRIVTIDDREVSQAYLVDATPSAVLITDGKIASPLVTGDDAIRSLVANATRPPAYKQGDLVSSLPLPDLEGNTFDLAQLAGRRTVLLFWSPTCGFCVDALDDVKWWERHRDAQLADMVVVSTGDAEGNRAQGFQSRVLLDSEFAAGTRFGAGGTPSAVIVDELGRVASAVAVGAPEVLALAGSVSPARQVVRT